MLNRRFAQNYDDLSFGLILVMTFGGFESSDYLLGFKMFLNGL